MELSIDCRGHRVTLLSGYAAKGSMKGLEEIVPEQLKRIVTKYGDHDYLGIRIRNKHVGSIIDAVMFGINVRRLSCFRDKC